MPKTYEPIATTTLASDQATVTFSSITGSYTDLILIAIIQDPNGYELLRVNNNSGSNYSRTVLSGNGTAASSTRGSNATSGFLFANTSTFNCNNLVYFMNYSNTTTNKTWLQRGTDMASLEANVNLWRSTAAIDRIDIICPSGSTIKSGSIFTLYGIKAA